ncbi:MAG: phosphate ABC transporter substrate-binding protein, partial [Armatimonadetes bacterium]|nr:phosphate ABC transporter substrate-binding protein [Armatimonadota bacterium]
MRSRTSPATALRKVAWLGFAVVATLGLGSCRPSGFSGLTIAGSTSVQPIAEMLAERYSASHPELVINVQGGGSSAGVRAAQSGAAQIGMASRELKPDEEGLQTHVMVLDAIVLIVHPSNRVRSLTKAQARGIFAGSIRNWRDLGGDAGRITCITREEGSGTRSAFEEMVMGKTTEIADDCIVQDSTGAARALVAGDRNSIAYVSLGMVTPDVV